MQKTKITKYLWIIIILFFSLGVSWNLLKGGYFSMHDDLQVMRLYEMEKCFLDGQIPCRWVPDMGAGFGYPLFNFYSPFPYYLGIFFRLINIPFVNIVKILFILSFVLSGVFMYFFTKEFFGKIAGLVSAISYLYAPYHALDVYVRGALAESWAITFFPLIFWSTYKFIKEEKKEWFLFSVFSLAALFLSHNIMTILFLPFLFVWMIFWLVRKRQKKVFFGSLLIIVFSIGLSSFFLFPAFFEKSLVNVSWLTSDYFDFRNHFVSLHQLFLSRTWGFGPSILGPNDHLSFQIGFVQWIGAFVSVILAFYFFWQRKTKESFVVILFFLIFIFSVFMTHAKSIFIWERLPVLSFVQFPWRFLAISIFASSFLVGALVGMIKIKSEYILATAIALLVVFLNLNYFRPERFYPKLSDQTILSGESWKTQSMGAILDYLPKNVKTIPIDLAPSSPWLVEGNANISEFAKRSDFWRFTFESINNMPSKVKVPVFDFPKWTVLIDQQKIAYRSDNPEGVIELIIPPGKHTIVGWFENSPLRTAANLISIFSLSLLIIFFIIKDFRNEKFF